MLSTHIIAAQTLFAAHFFLNNSMCRNIREIQKIKKNSGDKQSNKNNHVAFRIAGYTAQPR